MDITLEGLKNAIEYLKENDDWRNDLHSEGEYHGVLMGLNMIVPHFEKLPDEKVEEPKLKKYKVYMSGWFETTLYIEAENEEDAEMFASTECGFDSTDECIVTEIKGE